VSPDTDCRPILHRYANEDVSLGAWLIGLEVEHVDDRSMCCATPPGLAKNLSYSITVLQLLNMISYSVQLYFIFFCHQRLCVL
jgi:hypothetical protein